MCEGTGAGTHRLKTFARSASPQHSRRHSPLRAPVPAGLRRRRPLGGAPAAESVGGGGRGIRIGAISPRDGRPQRGCPSRQLGRTHPERPELSLGPGGGRGGDARARRGRRGARVSWWITAYGRGGVRRPRPRPPRRRRRRRRGCTELETRYARPGSEAPNPAPHLELKTAVGVGSPFSAGERVIRAQRAVTAPVPRCLALRLGG